MKFHNVTIQIKKASDVKLLIVVLAVHPDTQLGDVSPDSVNPAIKIATFQLNRMPFLMSPEKSHHTTCPGKISIQNMGLKNLFLTNH